LTEQLPNLKKSITDALFAVIDVQISRTRIAHLRVMLGANFIVHRRSIGAFAYVRLNKLDMKISESTFGTRRWFFLVKGKLSFKVLAKNKVQLRILLPESCKLHQSLSYTPERQNNF
tara:strand:- start:337 stop:687 length:351 start_codon:yes stop_codon:yes gene_type:complete